MYLDYDVTEADEAADGFLLRALENFRYQRQEGEAQGVIAMYEEAAKRLGATQERLRAAR